MGMYTANAIIREYIESRTVCCFGNLELDDSYYRSNLTVLERFQNTISNYVI